MKRLRFVGVALLTVLMSVGFSACGGDDDDVDNGGSSASIEGTWYVKSMKGYHCYITNGEVVPHNSNKNPDEEYDDNSKSVVVKVSLKDGNIYWNADGKGYSKHTFIFEKMGGNEYICKRPKSEIYDRIVIKDVSKDRLVFEWWDNYFIDASGTVRDTFKDDPPHFSFGIYTLIR